MQELGKFMSLVSDEKEKVTKIQEEKDRRFKPRVSVGQSLSDFFNLISEAPRIPRKKGQPAGSDKHSDLYTDENPKGTIHGLGFKDVETARASVKKIINSGKTHAHKIQAAIAMEQRARVMGKTAEAAVYRRYIEKMKKKTKEMQKEEVIQPQMITEQDNVQRIDVLKTFFGRLDKFEENLNQRQLAQKMSRYMPEQKDTNELTQLKEDFNRFRQLVQHQMSTIGGGGAVRLQDLDDVDTSSLGNGKFLVFNSSSGKLEFTDQVDGN
tara:strand:+ start:4964 stop:5764 length:801 start_codon:yes stop_codon:yes gene_type:complete